MLPRGDNFATSVLFEGPAEDLAGGVLLLEAPGRARLRHRVEQVGRDGHDVEELRHALRHEEALPFVHRLLEISETPRLFHSARTTLGAELL